MGGTRQTAAVIAILAWSGPTGFTEEPRGLRVLISQPAQGAQERNGSGAQGSAPGGTGGPDPAPRAARPAVTPPPPRGQQG